MGTARKRGKFHQSDISDGKRVARGQHWLFARTQLRARDVIHNARWKVLILAGEAPAGEIGCIRELMPHAHITALDRHTTAIKAARDAGADDVRVVADINVLIKKNESKSSPKVPACYSEIGEDFDVIHLDLCSPLGSQSSTVLRAWTRLLRRGGVMMVTFPYGRDVLEAFAEYEQRPYLDLKPLQKQKCPQHIINRVLFLFNGTLPGVCSIITYRGHMMPMCSVAFMDYGNWNRRGISYCALSNTDVEDVFAEPIDWCKVYDTPLSMIQEIRRRRSARKAAATARERRQHRAERRADQAVLPLLTDELTENDPKKKTR